jgi:Kef-type K+ transport system membrane component KefB
VRARPRLPLSEGAGHRRLTIGSAFAAISGVALLASAFRGIIADGWSVREIEPLFALGFLMIAGSVGGRLASAVGLPRLTGYLLVGALFGPHGFGIVPHGTIKSLTLINGLALALIALQAGAEFTTDVLKRTMKSVAWSTAAQTLIEPPFMCALFVLVAGYLEFTRGLSLIELVAVGTVWGAIALSKSPAATLAVLGETKAKGPLTEHVLGVVVVLDVLVLALFSIASAIARAALIPDLGFSLDELTRLATELFASIAAGTTVGLLMAFYFWASGKERLLFVIASAYGITAACTYLHYDTLLVFVVAGFVVTNLTRQGPVLIDATERLSTGVMVVFFATAGAKLDLEVLREGWLVALVLAGSRAAITFVACRIGHKLAKDPPVVRTYGWMGFVSQAGVTIGLTTIAAEVLPGVGTGIATLSIAVVGINELVGPILFKTSLGRANEIQPEEDTREIERPALPNGESLNVRD